MKIVLYSDDINLLSYWESVFKLDATVLDDFNELKELKNSLIIINFSAFNNSEKTSITEFKENNNSIFVLHRVPDIKNAKKILSYGVSGYGNALMKEHYLLSAVDAIRENLVWLHPEFTSQLIAGIPRNEDVDINSKISILSQREKEVSLLLKDGDTYKTIAKKLDITPRTIKAHASSIYLKLNVKDRLALALLLK